MKNNIPYIGWNCRIMSDGNAWELTDISKTQSFRYDGNVQGFPIDLNRSKQKV